MDREDCSIGSFCMQTCYGNCRRGFHALGRGCSTQYWFLTNPLALTCNASGAIPIPNKAHANHSFLILLLVGIASYGAAQQAVGQRVVQSVQLLPGLEIITIPSPLRTLRLRNSLIRVWHWPTHLIAPKLHAPFAEPAILTKAALPCDFHRVRITDLTLIICTRSLQTVRKFHSLGNLNRAENHRCQP
jgi:hypothetical protein